MISHTIEQILSRAGRLVGLLSSVASVIHFVRPATPAERKTLPQSERLRCMAYMSITSGIRWVHTGLRRLRQADMLARREQQELASKEQA